MRGNLLPRTDFEHSRKARPSQASRFATLCVDRMPCRPPFHAESSLLHLARPNRATICYSRLLSLYTWMVVVSFGNLFREGRAQPGRHSKQLRRSGSSMQHGIPVCVSINERCTYGKKEMRGSESIAPWIPSRSWFFAFLTSTAPSPLSDAVGPLERDRGYLSGNAKKVRVVVRAHGSRARNVARTEEQRREQSPPKQKHSGR